MLKVITVTNNIEATQPLINSLEKHRWDYEVIFTEWKGFGTKLISVYNYLKEHPEVYEFIFCDAFDVIALAGPDEFKRKMCYETYPVFSAEKGLWPPNLHPFKRLYDDKYYLSTPKCAYLNSGLYYMTKSDFENIMEAYPPCYEIDDQYYFNIILLAAQQRYKIILDNSQSIFNSYSFIEDGEYTYNNGRVQVNGQQPIFIHGNGRSEMSKIYELASL